MWTNKWETLGASNSHIRSNTKISQIEYQNISYWIQKYIIQYMNILLSTKIYYWLSKYISDHALKYIKLPTKIFQIIFQNILDCIPKYFSKTWRLRKTLSNHD